MQTISICRISEYQSPFRQFFVAFKIVQLKQNDSYNTLQIKYISTLLYNSYEKYSFYKTSKNINLN